MISRHFHHRIFLSRSPFLSPPSSSPSASSSRPPPRSRWITSAIPGEPPKGKSLDKYQRALTRDEFERLLETFMPTMESTTSHSSRARFACISWTVDAQTWFTLRFAKQPEHAVRRPEPGELPNHSRANDARAFSRDEDRARSRHIGGEGAKMESGGSSR